MSGRWVLSILRLLAFCVAVVVSRPAAALAPAIDTVVLASETAAVRAPSSPASDVTTSRRAPSTRLLASPRTCPLVDLAAGSGIRSECATRTPIVVEDKYLRHCSLLR